MAALRHGIRTVIIPADNERDLEEIDQTVRRQLNFVSASTVDTVLDSQEYVKKLSCLSGLPVFATSAVESIAPALAEAIPDVLPLRLQEKYFDLPSQKPVNRPLWG